jgi:hypothetical protein
MICVVTDQTDNKELTTSLDCVCEWAGTTVGLPAY